MIGKYAADGTRVPVIGLGTWEVGGGMAPDHSQDDVLVETLRKTIEMGYSHIDTAEMYAGGHTEKLVGRAIQPFDRQSLFITTKVWRTNLKYASVHRAFEASLQRLQTDYVDLYLIHWPDRGTPLTETFRALNELVATGRVRHLGVSNFDVQLLKESMQLSATPLLTNQVRYNLLYREYVRNGVLDFCQSEGVLLTAYSPLKDGVLANSVVHEVAAKYEATPGQIALAWLVQQPMVITIPKSTTFRHLKDNLNSLSLEVKASDVETLNKLA